MKAEKASSPARIPGTFTPSDAYSSLNFGRTKMTMPIVSTMAKLAITAG